ncbi:TolC family protein [Amorphus sp. MBR-141]
MPPASPAAKRWLAFDDPEMGRLIETALVNNPNVAIAEARVKQARARYAGSRAKLLPKGTVFGLGDRTRIGLGDTDRVNDAL